MDGPYPDCDGQIEYLFGEGDCPTCEGTGEIVHSACDGSGCSHCSDGAVTCSECDGSGYRPRDDGPDYD